jgi:hypothetical protein
VIERDGLTLGVICLSSAPADAALRAQVQTGDPVAAARSALASLPAGLDLVVAVGNLAEADADRVASEVSGLAAVLNTRGRGYDDPRTPRPGGAVVVEAPDRGRYVAVVRTRLGSSGAWPLVLSPDGQVWRRRAGLRRLVAADPASTQERAALEARFAEEGRGRNLASVEAVPLGAQYDGESAVGARIGDWKQERLSAVAAAARTPTAEERGYASAGACVNCHTNEFARWAWSPHARAWDALIRRKESRNPECVPCHTTGWGRPGGLGALDTSAVRRLKGVQCESCHGPMRGHPQDESIRSAAIAEAACTGCHDEANSPQFDFAPYLQRATCQGGAPATEPPPDVVDEAADP